jgi:predicted chitinase
VDVEDGDVGDFAEVYFQGHGQQSLAGMVVRAMRQVNGGHGGQRRAAELCSACPGLRPGPTQNRIHTLRIYIL